MVLSEIQFIEDLLENGLSPTPNPYEIQLLATFYRNMGRELKEKIGLVKTETEKNKLKKEYETCKNKEAVKKLIKEKCARYYKIPYTTYFGMLNTNIEKGWARKTPLKEIEKMDVSKGVIAWILSQPIENSYKKILFALYIQARLQIINPNAKAPPNIQNWSRKRNWAKFKDYAELSSAASAETIIRVLKNNGYIETSIYSTSFTTLFLEEEVIKTDLYAEQRDEYFTMTAYEIKNPAEFFRKYMFGSFTCQRCGKEVGYKNSGKNSQSKQKYCKECAEIMHKELANKKYVKKKNFLQEDNSEEKTDSKNSQK